MAGDVQAPGRGGDEDAANTRTQGQRCGERGEGEQHNKGEREETTGGATVPTGARPPTPLAPEPGKMGGAVEPRGGTVETGREERERKVTALEESGGATVPMGTLATPQLVPEAGEVGGIVEPRRAANDTAHKKREREERETVHEKRECEERECEDNALEESGGVMVPRRTPATPQVVPDGGGVEPWVRPDDKTARAERECKERDHKETVREEA